MCLASVLPSGLGAPFFASFFFSSRVVCLYSVFEDGSVLPAVNCIV